MKKIISLLVALMILCAATAALADPIVIGGIAPLTGPVSVYGIAVRHGVDLYLKELNENGGIDGNPIEITWLDDKHDTVEVINAYNRLLDMDGIAAIVGPVTSAPTLALLDMVTEDGIPLITPSGTADVVTENPTDNVFRACFKDSFQGEAMAAFAAGSLGVKNVAVLYDNTSDYSSGIAETFVKKAEELGLTVVANEACVAGAGDFKAQLTNIAAQNPEALMVPMYYGDLAMIVQQAHEIGIEAPMLGVDGWDGIQDVVEDMTLLNGYFFCNHTAGDDPKETFVAFREAYKAEYGEYPNTFGALGYDAIAVLVEGLKAGGTTDWAAIAEAMRAIDFEGITGRIRYDEYGDIVNKPGVINTIEEGQIKFYEYVTL